MDSCAGQECPAYLNGLHSSAYLVGKGVAKQLTEEMARNFKKVDEV